MVRCAVRSRCRSETKEAPKKRKAGRCHSDRTLELEASQRAHTDERDRRKKRGGREREWGSTPSHPLPVDCPYVWCWGTSGFCADRRCCTSAAVPMPANDGARFCRLLSVDGASALPWRQRCAHCPHCPHCPPLSSLFEYLIAFLGTDQLQCTHQWADVIGGGEFASFVALLHPSSLAALLPPPLLSSPLLSSPLLRLWSRSSLALRRPLRTCCAAVLHASHPSFR